MFRPQREVVLCLGKTGSGKTTLAKSLVLDQTRVIVLDPAGFNEYGILQVHSFEALRSRLIEAHHDGAGFFRIAYSPLSGESGAVFEMAQAVNFSSQKMAYVNQSWIVLEEADLLDPPEQMPEYDEVISRGRHYGVNILAVSLYPFKLPPMLRRQATKIYAFASHEPADIKWYRDVFGDRADEIINLPPHHYLAWDKGIVTGPLTLDLKKV